MRFTPVLLLLFVPAAPAQSLGAGVKGGIPFTSLLEARGTVGGEPLRVRFQRFTVGPMVELRLPFGLGVEFDALYKRFDLAAGAVGGGSVTKTVGTWEFPLLGKYRFGAGPAVPYLEAGVSFHRVSGFLAPFRTLPAPPAVQPEISETRRGPAAGAGVEVKLPVIRISAGLRLSYWGERQFLPATYGADLLLGLAF